MTLAHQFERIVEGGDDHRPHRHRRPHRDRLCARRPGAKHAVPAVAAPTPIPSDWSAPNCPAWTPCPSTFPAPADPTRGTPPLMSDSYYELVDADDARGEKFAATDLVRSTWSATIQHAAPVSALLVRALERCAQRDDTRLSRVVIDLLGRRARRGRPLGRARKSSAAASRSSWSVRRCMPLGPDGTPAGRARPAGGGCRRWTPQTLLHAPAPPLRPLARSPQPRSWPRTGTATTCTAWTGAG